MSGQYDRQPQNEIDGLYYHLITAPEREQEQTVQRLALPEADPNLEPIRAYDYHPDDVADLARWEQKTYGNVALWLLLMTVMSTVVVPFVPVFTPMVAMFFALMSVAFFLRSKLASEARVEASLEYHRQFPTMQWMGASSALSASATVYIFAVLVPYIAVPAVVQILLFLVAMNFTLYIPIAIMRTIRQRTLRRKRLSSD